MPRLARILVLITSVILAPCLRAADGPPGQDRQVENLAAFARVYGYVRFFHPSDEASAVDWDKVGVLGAEAVRNANTPEALRRALRGVFEPIAPTLQLTAEPATPQDLIAPPGVRVTFWQHLGLNLSNDPGPYRQRRVISEEKHGANAPLFEPASPPPALVKTIAPGVVLRLPLALPVDADGRTSRANAADAAALQAALAKLDLNTLTQADWRVRVAGVVTVWNVFQHFHPYLDSIGVKWDDALPVALRRTLEDKDALEYYATLSAMIAKSHDGHGFVYGRPAGVGGIPMRVAVVEGRIAVTGVGAAVPLRKGDIIERMDGAPGLEVLLDHEQYASGSPQLSEFRASNRFGEGIPGSVARLELVRDGLAQTAEVKRTNNWGAYFFNPVGEFEFPACAEVRPGIFYVNLYALSAPDLEAKLPQLAAARGVIFDWRSDGRKIDENAKRIQPHSDIISHLIDAPIQASPMLVPRITLPDRAGWTWQETTWPVQPKAPRLKGRIVFINEPSVVSYGETCMAMIADYHLATLVGAPTAGTNGNVGFIPLPGGFRVMWTGMKVLKHDRSPFYNVGFVPDYPVPRTLAGVKAGRDEYLEKAIEVIETSSPEHSAL